jgi:pilus assembly protein Flp/PilA
MYGTAQTLGRPQGYPGSNAPAYCRRRYSLAEQQGTTSTMSLIKALIRDEEGATMVEYGLLVALIALVALGAVQIVGGNLSTLFTNVGSSI